MDGRELLAIGEILDQLAAGELTEEVAAERLGWAMSGQSPACRECVTFRHSDATCVFPGRPERPESPDSVACHDFVKFDPRDVALPATPVRTNRMFK